MGPESTGNQLLLDLFGGEIPEKAPAYVACAFYFLGGLIALILTIKTKAWFMSLVTITAWVEVVGFALRLAVIAEPGLNIYIGMQAILIIVPVLLPLTNYIVIGRLVMYGNETAIRWNPKWVARVFTASDVFSLMLQGSGGGMISSENPDSQRMGRNLILAGLFIQLVFFTLFTSLSVWVQRSKRLALAERVHLQRGLFWGMYTTIALMYVRNIFRTAEFIQGYDGYLANHELFFYIFDFATICGCVYLYCIFHFGFYMPPVLRANQISPTPSEPVADAAGGKGSDLEMGLSGGAKGERPAHVVDSAANMEHPGTGWQAQARDSVEKV